MNKRNNLAFLECTGKAKYPSESMAEKYANKAEKRTGHEFSYYQCNVCNHWHIGHFSHTVHDQYWRKG